MRLSKQNKQLVVLVILGLLYFASRYLGTEGAGNVGRAPLSIEIDEGTASIVEAFNNQKSDVLVQTSATVQRILADDLKGSRHQRFIVQLETGNTVLIAHNIDLAPKVPLERGDRITFQGEYEYNEKGGVVHWTHHDPGGRHPGGWIELDGKKYE